MRGFGSDNHSGVHPLMLESIAKSNIDHQPSYGTDDITLNSNKLFSDLFETDCDVHYVFNGTAANVLSLTSCIRSYETVLVTDVSHLFNDECGAPEKIGGFKLTVVPSRNGKFITEDLDQYLIRRGDQHFSQLKAISITQPTEVGTCYTEEEMATLCRWAKTNGFYIHIDGARICNAVVSLKSSFAKLFTNNKVDVISFGGTKNGFIFGEAVVFLNKEISKNFKYLRKQNLNLPSKTRFIACQFETYLIIGLWKEIATHSLNKALELKQKMEGLVPIAYPTESNAVFPILKQPWIKPMREKHFFYVWDEKTFVCRWMTSWDTQSHEIDSFVEKLKELAR